MIKLVDGLTFDDVLLVPQFSKVKSRSEIDLKVSLSKGLSFSFPIVPANMKTVTGIDMANEISSEGGLAILHRFMPVNEQLYFIKELEYYDSLSSVKKFNKLNYIGFSIGVNDKDYQVVDAFADGGVKILCVDVAHGDSDQCIKMTKYISEKYPNIFLIAGNVATAQGAKRLWMAGADCVKVGIGPGSLCTTRIETGNGVPQLTAISNVYDMKIHLTSPGKKQVFPDDMNQFDDRSGFWKEEPPLIEKQLFIIADGGIKSAGDCVKSLCFADMIMAGNLFAGTDETPGEILSVDGKRYKNYVGSSTHKTNHIEGVAALVPAKGPVRNIFQMLFEGLRSGLSYQGSANLTELKERPEFIRITSAGLKESHPHDVIVIK